MKAIQLTSWKQQQYEPLNAHDEAEEADDFEPRRRSFNPLHIWLVAIGFSVSVVLNIVLLSWIIARRNDHIQHEITETSRSPYAKLKRDLPVAIEHGTEYSSHNLSHVRQLWEDISIDDGMIALPDDVAEASDLPEAQRFPWDHDKGIYFLNGYHNLHCLRSVHIALMEFHFGDRQSRNFNHVLHCMDALRQDIICNADDTPRYTTITKEPSSGVGQVRMCRDWSQLEQWSRRYNACYKFVNQTAIGFPQVLRYTYCPPGSPYIDTITDVFSKAGRFQETGVAHIEA